ncbi:MAG: isochorismatase family protein [Phycisphaera sp.]|nr:isochorismatase family protein [Phycisphaera sp.]
MPIPRLTLDDAAILVVDLQPKLLPVIDQHERITERCVTLIRAAAALSIPVIVTEQNPDKLGSTVEPVASVLPAGCLVEPKLKFSACVQPVLKRLGELNRRTVIVCGIEAHVCVMQTALDLVQAGYLTAVALDAIGSRRAGDLEAAKMRLSDSPIVPVSVEMVILELVREAGIEPFRSILPIIK